MMLLNFGCSLALGAELSDCPSPFSQPSSSTWPALAATKCGLDYKCHATGGCGNLSIMERVLIKASSVPDSMFVINWTFMDRFDYSDPNGLHHNKGTNDYLTLRPGNTDPVCQYYFRNLHSEHRDKIATLTYIKIIIDQLLQLNIKFLMTCVDPMVFCNTWHAPQHVKQLQAQVRPFIQEFESKNFLAWSRHRGYAVSDQGHPLEQAHAAGADLMVPVIDAILRKA
jgi:hypothetical protein